MMNRRLLFVLLGVVACAGILYGGFLLWNSSSGAYAEAATIAEGARDFKELSQRFEDLATEEGAVYAFEVLKRATLPPNTDTHLLGHVVGDQLYLQEGVDGIQYCTQDFRNACSHTIVIGALEEFGGEAALALIRDACKKAPGGPGAYTMCYHGLGHGVFAFYEYSFPETVDFCKKTGTDEYRNREYVECVGGAVMELMGGGGHDPELWEKSREKYLTKEEPLAPCTADYIPDEAKNICIIYLTPRIWEVAGINMGHPEPEKFADAFRLCDLLPRGNKELRDSCYGGFGKEFPTLANNRDIRDMNTLTDEALAKVVSWCKLAPEEGVVPCFTSSLRSLFWGGENNPELSFRFCRVAADDKKLERACYENLGIEIRQYLKGENSEAQCARLPEYAQAVCS
ncbi:hypothetical protein HY969_05115 [Candidatus Kaiserbacteria bacterium]|nr:hypothetical protein [Candidatus Kaiserbacteria bacterium]